MSKCPPHTPPSEAATSLSRYKPAGIWACEAQDINREGGRFVGAVFNVTVGVGDDTKSFTIHQSVLSQSPTLARMCGTPGFVEASSKSITLPDDPPAAFSLLVEYLYTLDFAPTQRTVSQLFRSPNRALVAQQAHLLGEVYVLAEQYMLSKLQELVTEKLKWLSERMPDALFFEVAKTIYDGVPMKKNTTSFFTWFTREARSRIADAPSGHHLMDLIEEGGPLAREIGNLMAEEMWRRPMRYRPPPSPLPRLRCPCYQCDPLGGTRKRKRVEFDDW